MPYSQSDARADRGGAERSDGNAVPTAFVRAGCQRAKDRKHAGPNECALAERVAALADLANGVARVGLPLMNRVPRMFRSNARRTCRLSRAPTLALAQIRGRAGSKRLLAAHAM